MIEADIRNPSLLVTLAVLSGWISWLLAMYVAISSADPTGVQSAGTLLIAGGILALIAGRSGLDEITGILGEFQALRMQYPVLSKPEDLPEPFDDEAKGILKRFNDLFESGKIHRKARRKRMRLQILEVVMIVFGTLQTGYGGWALAAIGVI